MLKVLEERRFPADELVLLASERSAGQRLRCFGREWPVRAVSRDAFPNCDVALFSAGGSRSREWAPIAAAAGAIVVDNSSAWRMDPDVPLVVPEINGQRVAAPARGIIANTKFATNQQVVAQAAGLRRVVATTFQSVSGAGNKGIAALDAELRGQTDPASPFIAPIAHNVLPYIGERAADGWNEEEEKIRQETRKIMELPELPVAATCVRVPVRVGHSISATVELERTLSAAQIENAFAAMAGLVFCRDSDPLPVRAAGQDNVYVGHVRVDRDLPNTLHMWIVADNLRKGAATNAVQIAEALRNV
jgi:aspartate-semialdehyde dehydrogenase